MNDDELRRKLLEPVGEGDTGFWASVDRSLEAVEADDGFVTALPADDPGQRLAPVTPIGRSARSFRAVLAGAAVLIVAAGGVAAGLLDRSTDSVATNQPAAESTVEESGQSDELSLTAPLDSLPTGTEICYANTEGGLQVFARANLLDELAISGYAVLPTIDSSLAVVDRFVGRRTSTDDVVAMAVTRFNQTERTRRNVEWTMTEAMLTTEDVLLDRVECDRLPATNGIGNGGGSDVDERQVHELITGIETVERSLELRPVDSTDTTLLALSGVDMRAGETLIFRFEAEAGGVLSYDVTATSTPDAVVLVGPASLALMVGPSASEVLIPHGGTHHLVVVADVGTALSVTVSN
jgi:hypothetical protein